MRNETMWHPTKYVQRAGRWRTNLDTHEVGVGSRLISDAVVKLYDEHLASCARGRLLDLGSGKVPLYGIYRGLTDSIICCDWADDVHIDIVSDLAKPLPFADAAFDTIILSDVLEHAPDPALVWREMSRVLSPGGHIVMNVPFFYWLHAHPYDFYRFTEFALARFSSMNGLELLHLEPLGGVVEVWGDLHAKLLARVPLVGAPLAALLQKIIALWGRSRWGKHIAKVSARHFPLGYFVIAQKPASAD